MTDSQREPEPGTEQDRHDQEAQEQVDAASHDAETEEDTASGGPA